MAILHSHAAVALVDSGGTHKVLVAGGSNGTSDLGTAKLYDVAHGTWEDTVGVLTPARRTLTLSALPNGRALAAGGHGKTTPSAATPLQAVDVYAPPIAAMATMNVARSWHTATPLKDATGNVIGVLVVGGHIVGAGSPNDDDSGLPSTDTGEVYGSQ